MHNGNTQKFRYKKKVFGRIKGEIQFLIGHNPDLLRASNLKKFKVYQHLK